MNSWACFLFDLRPQHKRRWLAAVSTPHHRKHCRPFMYTHSSQSAQPNNRLIETSFKIKVNRPWARASLFYENDMLNVCLTQCLMRTKHLGNTIFKKITSIYFKKVQAFQWAYFLNIIHSHSFSKTTLNLLQSWLSSTLAFAFMSVFNHFALFYKEVPHFK